MDRCWKSRPIGIRSPDRPVRSESLYRLNHAVPPGRCIIEIKTTVCLSVYKKVFFRLDACYIGTVYVPEFNIMGMMTMKITQYVAKPYTCRTGMCLRKPYKTCYVLIANYHYRQWQINWCTDSNWLMLSVCRWKPQIAPRWWLTLTWDIPVVLTITSTAIPRLTKIISSGITFVSRNVISRRFL